MSKFSATLGYWSAIALAAVDAAYGIALVTAAVFFPIPAWTNAADFMNAVQPAGLIAATLCQAAGFLLGPINLIVFCCLHEYAPADRKVLTRIGICAISAMMILGYQMYFMHFRTVQLMVSKGMFEGLDQFIEWNPNSLMAASGGLGWTFFAGLAAFCIAFVFSGGRLERWLRAAGLVCGICSMLGAAGILFENTPILVVYFGGATLAGSAMAVMMIILFRRTKHSMA
jgi:hypothetical protein